MAGSRPYHLLGGREAVIPHLFYQLMSLDNVMSALGLPLYADTTYYHAEAEDAGLIKALRGGLVKAVACKGREARLLPPAFWKIPGSAINAFMQGVIDTPAGIDIDGLQDVQGWTVVFDEASFERWKNPIAASHGESAKPGQTRKIRKPNISESELKKFIKKDGKNPHSAPSRDVQWKRAKTHFPNHNVPRAMVTEVRKSLWGAIAPGPRKRSED